MGQEAGSENPVRTAQGQGVTRYFLVQQQWFELPGNPSCRGHAACRRQW